MGDIKVGYHTITWGRDFDKALTEIAEVGYKAFETFGLTEHFDKVGEFKKYLKGKGVELASIYCGGSFIDLDKRDEEIENIVKTAEFIKELGSDRIILGGGRKKEVQRELVVRLQPSPTLDHAARGQPAVSPCPCSEWPGSRRSSPPRGSAAALASS